MQSPTRLPLSECQEIIRHNYFLHGETTNQTSKGLVRNLYLNDNLYMSIFLELAKIIDLHFNKISSKADIF